jgi:hypothetical protein
MNYKLIELHLDSAIEGYLREIMQLREMRTKGLISAQVFEAATAPLLSAVDEVNGLLKEVKKASKKPELQTTES